MNTTFASTALTGRTIIVSGASSGIGRETSIQMAAAGAEIIALGRDADRLEETVRQLSGAGHRTLACDLTHDSAWLDLDQLMNESDQLFGLIHCAGSQIIKPLRAAKSSDYRDMFDIHVVAAAELMKRISKRIGAEQSGSFVLLSSVSALRGGAGVGPYATAKAGVIALARSSALELSRQRIRVNCLVPGMVPTPMSEKLLSRLPEDKREVTVLEHPLGLGAPRNLADAATFLMTDAAAWITGTELPVDGGFLAR